MNIEFHYYLTWLVAARAGIRDGGLRVLSYSSQYVDDNDTNYPVKKRNGIYRNRISQTLNMLRPHKDKLEVYPLFHFIPGDTGAPSARRSDGKTNPFNTTPDSRNANRIMDAALATNDFYRIGIAAHAYADTWAHQNFAGCWDPFNAFPGFLNRLIPNCGHADAKHKPDLPRLVWQDTRLVDSTVDNKRRFLAAAEHLFNKLWPLANDLKTEASFAQLDSERQALVEDLRVAIGDDLKENTPSVERLAGYRELAARPLYGALEIPAYDREAWLRNAVKTTHTASEKRNQRIKATHSFYRGYRSSDWFKFQEAVKEHAECAKAVLCEDPFIAAGYGV